MIDSLARFGDDGVVLALRVGDDVAATLDAIHRACPASVGSAGRTRILVTHLGSSPADAIRVLASELRVSDAATERHARELLVPVVYDGEDLASVAARTGLRVEEVIARHSARTYVATVIGFLPGFAYLESLDPTLVVDRLAAPRRRVPSMSVAIAGSMTAIYPFSSSGGWNLLGRAVLPAVFDPARDPPALIQRGDKVRFEAAPGVATSNASLTRTSVTDEPQGDVLVLRAPAAASVQDLGRPRARAHGVPASGPLDLPSMLSANRRLGNPVHAATLEVPLGRLELRALSSIEVCLDREAPRRLSPGETFVVSSEGRSVRYLAVAGGLDVPLLLGSRATLAVASLGGHEGRYLQKGDRLSVGRSRELDPSGIDRSALSDAESTSFEIEDDNAIEVHRGPDLDDGRISHQSFDELVRGEHRVGLGDRMGVRLEGSKVHRTSSEDRGAPEPTVRGVVQLTGDGTPIILGPDCAVTGGYPIIGVLSRRGQYAFARRVPGAVIRFCEAVRPSE